MALQFAYKTTRLSECTSNVAIGDLYWTKDAAFHHPLGYFSFLAGHVLSGGGHL